MVKTAETKYKGKYGRYGELADLRKAHLLDASIFESDSLADDQGEAEGNFGPTRTSVQVTVSNDGQHFNVEIHQEELDGRAVSIFSNEHGGGVTIRRTAPLAPIEDVPDRPIINLPIMLPG